MFLRINAVCALWIVLTFASETRSEADPPQRFDASIRGGLVASDGFSGSSGGVLGGEFGYRLTSAWRVGGYLGFATVKSTIGDTAFYDHEYYEALRFGARGEWHARPTAVVDPWLGASAGAFDTVHLIDPDVEAGLWGVDIGADAGLDFHIGSTFTAGLLFAVAIPLVNGRQAKDRATGVGMIYSACCFGVPVPLARLGVAF